MSEEVIVSSSYIDENGEKDKDSESNEQPDQKVMLKRLRNQRAYHLRRINNPDVDEKHKEKNRKKITEILEKIAELTNKVVEEVMNEYKKGQKGRPKKQAEK